MASFLITPTEAASWRVDTDDLGTWLAATWQAGSSTGTGVGQQVHLWSMPDSSEVWVPEDREVVWADGTGEVLASLAVWCSERATQPLILTDEGYSNPVPLMGLTQPAVLAALDSM